MLGWSVDDVSSLKTIAKSAKLSEKEQKMLDFVVKSVEECKKADENELNDLRELGWNDKDILDALQHGARMSAIDIIFNVFDIENDN
jgi:alkylhydroperoxidase family enzyme